MRTVVAFSIVCASVIGPATAGHDENVSAQQPPAAPALVDSPTVKVLTGLTVPEFETEMQLMTQALGLSCGSCHARGNFASEANPRKIAARRMLEMTRTVNSQFFPDYKPQDGESRLGRVTCFTCHQGDTRPKTQQ
jgi:photosynthetic reaction center cytochrome c subunit